MVGDQYVCVWISLLIVAKLRWAWFLAFVRSVFAEDVVLGVFLVNDLAWTSSGSWTICVDVLDGGFPCGTPSGIAPVLW